MFSGLIAFFKGNEEQLYPGLARKTAQRLFPASQVPTNHHCRVGRSSLKLCFPFAPSVKASQLYSFLTAILTATPPNSREKSRIRTNMGSSEPASGGTWRIQANSILQVPPSAPTVYRHLSLSTLCIHSSSTSIVFFEVCWLSFGFPVNFPVRSGETGKFVSNSLSRPPTITSRQKRERPATGMKKYLLQAALHTSNSVPTFFESLSQLTLNSSN